MVRSHSPQDQSAEMSSCRMCFCRTFFVRANTIAHVDHRDAHQKRGFIYKTMCNRFAMCLANARSIYVGRHHGQLNRTHSHMGLLIWLVQVNRTIIYALCGACVCVWYEWSGHKLVVLMPLLCSFELSTSACATVLNSQPGTHSRCRIYIIVRRSIVQRSVVGCVLAHMNPLLCPTQPSPNPTFTLAARRMCTLHASVWLWRAGRPIIESDSKCDACMAMCACAWCKLCI